MNRWISASSLVLGPHYNATLIGTRGSKWLLVGVALVSLGCPGYPPPLPELLTMEASTTEPGTETDHGTSEEQDRSSDGSTGPSLGCGDGKIGPGEDCDGDHGDATCESLGYTEGTLTCANCTFDASDCGPAAGMVLIPGGVFQMGSLDSEDEQPVRLVQVDTFWIDVLEVTVAEYTECVNAGACVSPSMGDDYNYYTAGREDHPINGVNWQQSVYYCSWADGGMKRLPTEAEWEKAARGPAGNIYAWGDEPEPGCDRVVMGPAGEGCGAGSTWPVGGKPSGASTYGVLDMAGNVQEWVADWYGMYETTSTDNPTGHADGTQRVLRGGHWKDPLSTSFRGAVRVPASPSSDIDSTMGFRCARTPPSAPESN